MSIPAILDVLRARLPAKEVYYSRVYEVPGIGAATLYTTGDAFGTGFWVDFPKSGVLETFTFIDLDNEGVAKTVLLFRSEVTTTADNAEFAPTASDFRTQPVIQFNLVANDFVTFDANQMATVTAIGLPYEAPAGKLWVRLVTRGGDNIAAGSSPLVSFGVRDGRW